VEISTHVDAQEHPRVVEREELTFWLDLTDPTARSSIAGPLLGIHAMAIEETLEVEAALPDRRVSTTAMLLGIYGSTTSATAYRATAKPIEVHPTQAAAWIVPGAPRRLPRPHTLQGAPRREGRRMARAKSSTASWTR